MIEVSKIVCENKAAFVQCFRIKWADGVSAWSETYPYGASRSIDLTTLDIFPGSEVWIEVKVVLGKNKSAEMHVRFVPFVDAIATYRTTGTVFRYAVSLIHS